MPNHYITVDDLRRRETALRRELAQIAGDNSRHQNWISDETAKRRTKAAADARALASGPLAAIDKELSALRGTLPGRDPGAALRLADAARMQRPGDAATIARLGRSSVGELTRLAETADVVLLDDIRRELDFRNAQGSGGDVGLTAQIERRLREVAAALPETQRRQEEFDRLELWQRNITATLKAIETGAADEGVRDEQVAGLRRSLDSGEITQDAARAAAQEIYR